MILQKKKTVSMAGGPNLLETVLNNFKYSTSKRVNIQDLPALRHGYIGQLLVSRSEHSMGKYILQAIAGCCIHHCGGNHE